jgi:hypothetical protein
MERRAFFRQRGLFEREVQRGVAVDTLTRYWGEAGNLRVK